MPKVGGRRKKHRTHREYDTEAQSHIPKSFVFRKGKVPLPIKELVRDFRTCMYPNTAMKLEDSKKLKLSAYVRSARHYGVTHLVGYHTYNKKSYVRFMKGDGPVITFRIINYCRSKDIRHHLENSLPVIKDINSPLLVLNNFQMDAPIDLKSIAGMLQSMFPPLNMNKIEPKHIKRVISFTYMPNNHCIYFRNYRVKLATHGIDKPISDILEQDKKIDFSQYRTFADYLEAQNSTSQPSSADKPKQTVKLYEVGPRMKLKFHRFDQKLDIADLPQDQQMDEHEMEVQQGQQQQQHEPRGEQFTQ